MGEFAKSKGIKLKDVKKLIADGILAPAVKLGHNNRKWINRALADKLYQDHQLKENGFITGPSQDDKDPQNDQQFDRMAPAAGYRPGSQMVTGEHSGVYSKARAAKETMAAKLAQVKYEKIVGNLVEVDEVKKTAKALGLNLRNALLNLPNKLAPLVAAETDVLKVKLMLDEEIKVALNNLSRGDFEFLEGFGDEQQ